MKEICTELSERIKNKEISLIEKDNNVNIIIALPSSKIKEISFELKEDEKNEKDKINELNTLIIELHNEFKNITNLQQKEIDNLKNITNKQTEEINNLKNIINKQNNEINELKEILITTVIDKETILNLDSLIIKNNIDYNKSIKKWIDPNKMIKAKLLYRLTRDGEEISKFHELCDNTGPTLTLFCTEDENKGGIFTPLSWDIHSSSKKDMETFMFNLNMNQKYQKINNNLQSIACRKDCGPWTYGFGFYKEKMKKISHDGKKIDLAFENGSDIIKNISNSEKYFDLKEVEVFKIKY